MFSFLLIIIKDQSIEYYRFTISIPGIFISSAIQSRLFAPFYSDVQKDSIFSAYPVIIIVQNTSSMSGVGVTSASPTETYSHWLFRLGIINVDGCGLSWGNDMPQHTRTRRVGLQDVPMCLSHKYVSLSGNRILSCLNKFICVSANDSCVFWIRASRCYYCSNQSPRLLAFFVDGSSWWKLNPSVPGSASKNSLAVFKLR